MTLNELQYFHFLRPYWLLAIVPLLIMVVWLLKRTLVSRSWQSVVDPRLLPFILTAQQGRLPHWPVVLLALVGVMIITALAGPVWEKLPQPVYRSQSGLVIALDMSQSMDATDIKPSRISRAKHKVLDILARRAEGQTALVVYASQAFVVSPLSDDVKTIESLVTSLSTDLMPNKGSRPHLAVEKAIELLQQSGMRNGNILLITDGVGGDSEEEIAAVLAGKNYRLSVLAVGTSGGAPVQLSDGSLLKDRFGDIVIPKLQEQPLRNLANNTGGRYSLLTPTDKDINYLSRGFEFTPLAESDNSSQMANKQLNLKADTWREEGPWLLLLVAPFVALAFRKGWLGALALCVLLPLPQPGHALSWDGLWKNQNQQAQAAFEQGQHQQAAQQFRNKHWQAAAYYKAGDYEKTLELLEHSAAPEDIYNKGNALARLGRIREAIEAYDNVLKQVPEHEDAIYNKQALEKFLRQQENQDGDSKQQQQRDQADNQQKQQSQSQQNQQGEGNSQDNTSGGDSEAQDQSGERDGGQSQQSLTEQSQSQQTQPQREDDSFGKQGNELENTQLNESQREQGSEQNSVSANSQDDQQASDPQSQQQPIAQQSQQVDPAQREALQAQEQWLRRIPDDPGGLLRRKFRYQSQQMQSLNQQQTANEEPW